MKKLRKRKKPEPLRLYFTYDERRTGGELINPDEQWSSREPSEISISFHEFYRLAPPHRFFYDSIEVDENIYNASHAYLAVIRYSTGDSFGHTEGAWHIVGATLTRKEAEELLDKAINSKNSYKPWEGHFEKLTGPEVYRMIIE